MRNARTRQRAQTSLPETFSRRPLALQRASSKKLAQRGQLLDVCGMQPAIMRRTRPQVEVVARTLRPQLRRSAGGARLFAKCSAKRPPFWGPERGPQKGGRRSCSLSFLRTGAGGARFWGRFLDPKMGAAFCVKNIAEAECATREHVSACKRACPKLLVVGRSLCSALVPKSWPSADSCWTCAACNLPSCVAQDRKSKWLQEHSARNCGAAQVELVCLQNAAQSGPHFGARNVGPKRGAAEAARYPS